MNICRHSLIFGLSYALDIAGNNNLSHSKSVAYISVMIGRRLDMAENKILHLYYIALLHDIGMGLTYQMKPHCIDGERMLKNLPLPNYVAKSVLYHHEYSDGSGLFGLSGNDIPREAQIVCLASDFDDAFGMFDEVYCRNLFTRVRAWLDTNRHRYSRDVADAFSQLIEREHFLLDYFNQETKYHLSRTLVVNDLVRYSYGDIEKYARCFSDVIDRRSSFTYTHSHGIAKLARIASSGLGYSVDIQNQMYIAGLLHDIGKLCISPDILHKPGPLTLEERFEMNKHPYYTRKILEQIEGFEDIVNYAANHHEKIDGSGYPYHLQGQSLGELCRLMAICDVYQALTEQRPYRKPLLPEEVWGIIDEMVDKQHLDKALVEKVKPLFNYSNMPLKQYQASG